MVSANISNVQRERTNMLAVSGTLHSIDPTTPDIAIRTQMGYPNRIYFSLTDGRDSNIDLDCDQVRQLYKAMMVVEGS